MVKAHNSMIAAAAKSALGPLRFKRQGRSRLWLLDHGTWLNIVGFVPSRWSVSVDLDNAAHWLWCGTGFMSLDYSVRGNHAEFQTEEQFNDAVTGIARQSADRALEIERRFCSFEKMALFAIERARGDERMGPSWFGYQAGLACGILNRLEEAEFYLRGVTDRRVVPHALPFLSAVGEHAKFVAKVNEGFARQRVALKLPTLLEAPF